MYQYKDSIMTLKEAKKAANNSTDDIKTILGYKQAM